MARVMAVDKVSDLAKAMDEDKVLDPGRVMGVDKALRVRQLLAGRPDSRNEESKLVDIYSVADELEGVDEQALRDRIARLRNGAGKD